MIIKKDFNINLSKDKGKILNRNLKKENKKVFYKDTNVNKNIKYNKDSNNVERNTDYNRVKNRIFDKNRSYIKDKNTIFDKSGKFKRENSNKFFNKNLNFSFNKQSKFFKFDRNKNINYREFRFKKKPFFFKFRKFFGNKFTYVKKVVNDYPKSFLRIRRRSFWNFYVTNRKLFKKRVFRDRKTFDLSRAFSYFRPYRKDIINTLFPYTNGGRAALELYKLRNRRVFLRVIIRYFKFRILLNRKAFLKRYVSFKTKNLYKKYLKIRSKKRKVLSSLIKKLLFSKIALLKDKLQFSLKDFYRFYILKLFSSFNFKYFFFKMLKTMKVFNKEIMFRFLKYEFFGHVYFKNKLLYLLKYKLLHYFFLQLNVLMFFNKKSFVKKILRKKRIKNKNRKKIVQKLLAKIYKKKRYFIFYIKNKISFFFKNNVSFLKNWLLTFFLNGLNDVFFFKSRTLDFFCTNDLKKNFMLFFYMNDKNVKNFLKYSKKFNNWFFYRLNRNKKFLQDILHLVIAVAHYKMNFWFRKFPLTIFNISKFYESIYKTVLFFHINIRLNNVFLTVSNIYGKVLYKFSAGFYGVSGKKKRNPLSLKEVSNSIARRLSRFEFLNLILRTRKNPIGKFHKEIFNCFKKHGVRSVLHFYISNRRISKRRLKKARRL